MYLVKRLFRPFYWNKQREWTQRMFETLSPMIPEGVNMHTGGWMRGCQPFFQVEGLEWLEIGVKYDETDTYSWGFYHRYHMHDGIPAEVMLREARKMKAGMEARRRAFE